MEQLPTPHNNFFQFALSHLPNARGLEEGKLAGRIQTLQELLGDAVSTDDELLSRDRETLLTELARLQARLRHRDA
jgi:hypothetical protein